jgi:Flp pilus assembly protein TadD, contains TPR repeats
MAKTALDRAERLFAAGRYAELVTLLEPQVPVYRESSRFYYLLGCSCLRSGDPGGALTYLKRAEQLSPESSELMLALAALSVRRLESEKAIDYYLRILEEKPGDRRARRGLAMLRKEGGPEGLSSLVESGRIERLYPKAPSLPRFIVPVGAVAILALAAWLLLPLGASLAESLSRPRVARPEVAAVSLASGDRASPVLSGGSFRYILTEKEALEGFERAKDYFQQYRDNAALVEINRLLGSNASPGVKEKAKSLRLFVGKPDFRTVRDAPSFAQAQADPGLYEGCVVVWKGMAANVRKEGGATRFDFLAGYQDKKVLEGLAPASISDVDVPMDRGLELLATIKSQGSAFSLACAAIHELPAQK